MTGEGTRPDITAWMAGRENIDVVQHENKATEVIYLQHSSMDLTCPQCLPRNKVITLPYLAWPHILVGSVEALQS